MGLYLVVARGTDTGASVALEPDERLLGRGRDADLVLLDPRVSRKHLRVSLEGDAARVRACEGAGDFLLEGRPTRDALVAVGATLVVGNTALVLLRKTEGADAAPLHGTEVGTLLTGVAADVRGLAASMALVDALDAAEDEAAIGAALDEWARVHVGATGGALLTGDAIDGTLREESTRARRVVERAGGTAGSLLMLAPAHALDLAWIAVTCANAPTVTDTQRRLVAIAGRLVASTLARVRSLRRSEEDGELFRRASMGSARSFLGDSAAAREVARLVSRLASSDTVVLLEGETGTGKTFLARLVHESGVRAKAPFRVINCAAIPEALIESELFGHEKGAFTGATASRAGVLEAAGRGTVLLDEIGEMPLASQAKLLRVLEERRFERVGSNRHVALEARVLAATNRDLAAMAQRGEFRQDLYFRIAVVKLRVPALRERGDDLVLLAARILSDLTPSAGRRIEGFSQEALDAIRRYPWPGNVRELRNAIERAIVVGDGLQIERADLPDTVIGAVPPQPDDESMVRLPARLDWIEGRAIAAALRATGGNQRRAAVLLGINRVTLHRKLRAGE